MKDKLRRCVKCGEEKPISHYPLKKCRTDGIDSSCKECVSLSQRTYRRSTLGVATLIHTNQKRNSKRRGHAAPNYTRDELLEWLLAQPNFERLYDDWIGSGYTKLMKPSVDRLDDYKGYSFDNIQLMTWGENKAKGHEDSKNGINNKRSRAVLQYSVDGEFIKEYYSMSQASREVGILCECICGVCNGRYGYKTAGGFKWVHKEEAQ